MKQLFTIDLHRDFHLVRFLQIMSLALIIPSGYLLYLPVSTSYRSPFALLFTPTGLSPRVLDLFIIALTIVCVMTIHELLHALFFLILGPKGTRITFGIRHGFAYAASPNTLIPKNPYLIIGLSPFVIITLVYLFISPSLPESWASSAYIAAVLNAAGSSGDFYITYRIFPCPKGTLIKDRGMGFTAYLPTQAH